MARYGDVPILSTMHGRLDVDGMPELLGEFSDVPLVAISESQRRWFPEANWVATSNSIQSGSGRGWRRSGLSTW